MADEAMGVSTMPCVRGRIPARIVSISLEVHPMCSWCLLPAHLRLNRLPDIPLNQLPYLLVHADAFPLC